MNGSRWRLPCGDAIQKSPRSRGRARHHARCVCFARWIRSLTPAGASDIRSASKSRTYANSNRINSISNVGYGGFLPRGSARCAALEASRGHEAAHEVYAPSVTAGIYLVNFVFLYMANPDLAAYMPAYKAPIPQPIVDCLEQNPTGTAVPMLITGDTSISRFSITGNASGRRFARRMRDGRVWRHAKLTQPQDINEPLGRRRADQFAHLLGIDAGMILTARRVPVLDRDSSERSGDREIIFNCIYNLTNSTGNAVDSPLQLWA